MCVAMWANIQMHGYVHMGMCRGQSRTFGALHHHFPPHSFHFLKQDLSLNLEERLAANKLQQVSCLYP